MAGKKRKAVTQQDKDDARSLWEGGRKTRDIADAIGVSYGAIRAWITSWRKGIVVDAGKQAKASGAEVVEAEVVPISMALRVAVPIRRDPRVHFESIDRAVVIADESVLDMSTRTIKSMTRSTMMMMLQIELDLEEQQRKGRVEGIDRDLGQSARLMVGCTKDLLAAIEKMGTEDDNAEAKRMIKEASKVHKLSDGEELDSEFAAMTERMRLAGDE